MPQIDVTDSQLIEIEKICRSRETTVIGAVDFLLESKNETENIAVN